MTIIEIFLIILIISASALCIYLIFTLKKITKEAEAVRIDIHNLVEKALPVLDDLAEVSVRANRVVKEVENYWDEIDSAIKNLKEKVSNFTSLKAFRSQENQVKDFVSNLRAFVKGISAFWQSFKSK